MDKEQAVHAFKQFIIEHGLPQTDMSLFGVKCPYCGKSDRIRELDPPEDLQTQLNGDDAQRYSQLWDQLKAADFTLGVCKFCHNPLRIDQEQGLAEPLLE